MAGGDLVLWPLWEENEAISRSYQGKSSGSLFLKRPFSWVPGEQAAFSPLGHVLLLTRPCSSYDFTNAIHFSSQYLSRNVVHSVRREHFSFSPRMPVGDFFEERDTPEVLAKGLDSWEQIITSFYGVR